MNKLLKSQSDAIAALQDIKRTGIAECRTTVSPANVLENSRLCRPKSEIVQHQATPLEKRSDF